MERIGPQEGFQEDALATSADIAILGGAAGAGKSFVLLLEACRHLNNSKFTAIGFRRTTPQITNPGGLWDTSTELYNAMGGTPKQVTHDWRFPSGATIGFRHIEHEKNKINWQGSQVAYFFFDELTHFTESMFFYMFSRNRSTSGVQPYIRASCNPDPDSWVARLIEWWIDPETGDPIPERCGVIRYMTQENDVVVWGDTVEEVYNQCPNKFRNKTIDQARPLIKSFTFIPGSLYQNKILMEKDPGYEGNLMALPEAEQAQLLRGNWKIRLDGLGLFDYMATESLFDNYPGKEQKPLKCITCDPARFGQDLCVIFVWEGWEVKHITIFVKSDVHDIVNHIEQLRGRFMIMKHNVLIDQDGLGGDTRKMGNYRGFSGGASPIKDPKIGKSRREQANQLSYEFLKTQCYYLAAMRVNEGQVRINVTPSTVLIYEDGKLNPRYTTKFKLAGKIVDVKDLIKADLRAIKRAQIEKEFKLRINTKDEQKLILGRSPDFGDNVMMREYFDLKQVTNGGMRRDN